MSVQFGRWNFGDEPLIADYFEKVSAVLAPYGPDSSQSYSKGGIKILYHAFHTTKESHSETQPHVSAQGAVITWDGRLDNRAELINELRTASMVEFTDIAIVATAHEKWGTNCFAKLIGDWALSVWNPLDRSLILAKDPIGTRHLYYALDKNHVTWSSILDPLVQFAGKTFAVNEEYIAGWLSTMFPAPDLTPYVGIHAVPPSSYVHFRTGQCTISKYWDFDPARRLYYSTDGEYEEHFRAVLATAVQRRLRSDGPVLAELSGGMDSSSIVCMADTVIARGEGECPRLDTISWYDDSYDHIESDTNELHWITKVEEKRGRTGYHINLHDLEKEDGGSQASFDPDTCCLTFVPPSTISHWRPLRLYAAYMRSRGSRVTLSGIGGGEITGGDTPTPTPELQNLLVRARFFTLISQLQAWAVRMRKPPLPLLGDAIRGFFSAAICKGVFISPWLQQGFVRRNRTALFDYPLRIKLFGPRPSFQHALRILEADRRVLAHIDLSSEMLREIRYPYFDRDLLEFMYAIPREQIVRVGERRSLMKRAMRGIVPPELLARRRKAFVPPQLPRAGVEQWFSTVVAGADLISTSMGIIDSKSLWGGLLGATQNKDSDVDNLTKALTLEAWLHRLTAQGFLTSSASKQRYDNLQLLRSKSSKHFAKQTSSTS